MSDPAGAVLLEAWQDWECPACGKETRTRPVPPNGGQFHRCPRLHGLTAPMVRAGTDCRLAAVDRGDYVGREHVQLGDDNRAYMAIETRHGSGRLDCAVLAPAAIARLHL
jgi:hypothetical protein